jgi:hypothetical protein
MIGIVFYLNNILERVFAAISDVINVVIGNSYKFKIIGNNNDTWFKLLVRESSTAEEDKEK